MIQWKLPLIIFLFISSTCFGQKKVANKQQNQTKEVDLFSKPPECGPISVGSKIYSGKEAELGEFPWLANLEYRTVNGDLEDGCAGNILNHRYVVTAGHCVKDPIGSKLESLRVGDHNTAKPVDCDASECLDPYQRLLITETIVHENYERGQKGKVYNDIALLKTNKNIIYTFAVAPICLPEVIPSLEPPMHDEKLTVAGWRSSAEKLIMDVAYIANNACQTRVEDTQICAGGQPGQDSCGAVQSGSALSRRTSQAWVIEGLVSYGSSCGSGKPTVYTRIRSFLPWIHEKMEKSVSINTKPIQ